MADSRQVKRVLDHDPVTGKTEYFYYDEDTDRITLETVMDLSPMFAVTEALRNDTPSRWGEWTRVASLDPVTIMELSKQGIMAPGGGYILDQERMKKWLNDRDFRKFRTREGYV